MVPMSESKPLKKWIVWVADNAGDYVKAHRVIDGSDYLTFVKETLVGDVIVGQYNRKDVKEYNIVE